MEQVIEAMKALCPLSEDTIRELTACVTPERYPKKYRLVEAGKYARAAFFIEKGMTRSYWLVNGQEITTSFSCEGGIVFSMDELYYGKISEEYVETIEEVLVYRISLEDLRRLFHTNLELSNWGRIIHQNEYRRLHRSHKERLTLSAKEPRDHSAHSQPLARREIREGEGRFLMQIKFFGRPGAYLCRSVELIRLKTKTSHAKNIFRRFLRHQTPL